jgi:hypothetical protein
MKNGDKSAFKSNESFPIFGRYLYPILDGLISALVIDKNLELPLKLAAFLKRGFG